MTNRLRPNFCKIIRSMELAGHARFDAVTALILRIKVYWVVLLDSMAFIQDDDGRKFL
jgi:hypothetical protein